MPASRRKRAAAPEPLRAAEMEALREENRRLRETLQIVEDNRAQLIGMHDKLNSINRISQDLNVLDLDRIAKLTVQKVPELIDAKYCSLFYYDYAHNELVLQAHNHPEQITERIAIKLHKNTIMGLALSRKEIIHIEDIDEFERGHGVRFERTFADKYATRSCISMPLLTGSFLVGVLNFADKRGGGIFGEVDDVPIVRQIGQVVAMAVRNCDLYREVQNQARTDGLTHLSNYRSFHENLRTEMHRATRYVRPLSLLMIDIDNFKTINDRWGHTVGDRVLSEVAVLVRSAIRREDFAARYGGDEIALLLPETPVAGAVIVARRLVVLAKSQPILQGNEPLPVSFSIGIAELVPEWSVTEFVDAADQALLTAKQKGKDRFELCPPRS